MGWGQSSGCRADGSGFAPRLTCGTVRIDVQELQTDFPEVEDGRLDCYLADEARGLEALLGVELTAHGLKRWTSSTSRGSWGLPRSRFTKGSSRSRPASSTLCMGAGTGVDGGVDGGGSRMHGAGPERADRASSGPP